MRLINALLHAMRARRAERIDLEQQADRWVAGDPPADHQGLAELLAAAKAPATAEELAGERAAVAGFAAARRAASPRGRSRVRMSRSTRAVVVNAAAGLVLVGGAGTAVAARTGNLPDGAQQHAHRLFSALGVPAPRTVRDDPSPLPSASPSETTSRPHPTPTPGVPATSPAEAVAAGWCRTWSAAPHDSNARWRRDLIAAAGGEQNIPAYCTELGVTPGPASPTAKAPTGKAPTGKAPNAKSPATKSPATKKGSKPATPGQSKKPPGEPNRTPTSGHPGKAK
jgi:hypothetical protein